MFDVASEIKDIGSISELLSSDAMIIEAYANSIIQQPKLFLPKDESLKLFEKQINDVLLRAKIHAESYLDSINPKIIELVSNVFNYCSIHDAVMKSIPEGATKKECIESIGILIELALKNERDGFKVEAELESFYTSMEQDAYSFKAIVNNLNDAVSGDRGKLASYQNQLSMIEDKIITEMTVSISASFTLSFGTLMIILGKVTNFKFAKQLKVPLMFGGIGMVVGSMGAIVTSTVVSSLWAAEKKKIVIEKVQLETELKFTAAISETYASLTKKIDGTCVVAKKMVGVWGILSRDLEEIIANLKSGLMSKGDAQKVIFKILNLKVNHLINDVENIKEQMTNVNIFKNKEGLELSKAIIATCKIFIN